MITSQFRFQGMKMAIFSWMVLFSACIVVLPEKSFFVQHRENLSLQIQGSNPENIQPFSGMSSKAGSLASIKCLPP